MGIREQAAERERQRRVAEAAALEIANLEQQSQEAKERAPQELMKISRDRAPFDNQAIVKLLQALPFRDLGNYLKMIQGQLGYKSEVVLYSHSADIARSTTDETYYAEVNAGLRRIGLDPNKFIPNTEGGESAPAGHHEGFRVLDPGRMFCGDNTQPRVIRMRLLPPWSELLTEPTEPGIGIALRKHVSSHSESVHVPGGLSVTIKNYYQSVYVRFGGHQAAIITGSGEKLSVTQQDIFDQALERSLSKRHNSVFSRTVFQEIRHHN